MRSNQILDNPFPFSNTNKRYYTLSYYYKEKYGQKVCKVPLDAGFTCPNRDGKTGFGGCTFCSSQGSGDSILARRSSLAIQFEEGLERMRRKWPNALGVAYFQAYSNTYADLETLKAVYDPFFEREDVLEISIATRADCLNDEIVEYLSEMAKRKPVWIELGLQSIFDETMKPLNRGHSSALVFEWIEKLKKTPIRSCVHLINGLPNETLEMMKESAKKVGEVHPDAIKIHMLHVVKNSIMGKQYLVSPFPLLERDEYVDLVVSQLETLPLDMIVERLTGDAIQKELIEPEWTLKKTIVLNQIDQRMVERNTWQGKLTQTAGSTASKSKNKVLDL